MKEGRAEHLSIRYLVTVHLTAMVPGFLKVVGLGWLNLWRGHDPNVRQGDAEGGTR